MKHTIIISFFMLSSIVLDGQESKISEKLELKWETKGFDTPECVILSESENLLYVSNVGGKNPTEKDGNGFISKMKPGGEITDLSWVGGLNAPKGMAVSNGFLYVTDIDKVVKIDIQAGKIVYEYNVEKAQFLNDIVTLKNGNLLVSDSQAKSFILISGEDYKVVLQDTGFGFPNGLALLEEDIIAGIGDRIIRVNSQNWETKDYILQTGGVDGLAPVKDDLHLISDWKGRVHLISPDSKKLILDTTELEDVNAADLYYDSRSGKLYIPTFFNNSVACYQLTL